MRFRGTTIRRKIVALLLIPLVSLTLIWAFAATITGREVFGRPDIQRIVDSVGYPADDTVRSLQQERRVALVYLANPRDSEARIAYDKQKSATDATVAKMRTSISTSGARGDLNERSRDRLDSMLSTIEGVTSLRQRITNQRITRNDAYEAYNALVDPVFDLFDEYIPLSDVTKDSQRRAVIGLYRAQEEVSREDALMAAAISTGHISKDELRSFTFAVAEQRNYYAVDLKTLTDDVRAPFDSYWQGANGKALRTAEDAVIGADSDEAPVVAAQQNWPSLAGTVMGDLGKLDGAAIAKFSKQARPLSTTLVVEAVVIGVLGLIAVIASVIVSVRIGRSLIRDLTGLRREAQEVSGTRLPRVMRRLAAGEQVDVETEVPRLQYSDDEIGQVGKALNTLQRAAVEAAVRQSDMRKGVSEVFVNLARRSQVLLHRQLTLLDAMERRTENAEELADLFRLDHMTTRMRRHAEGLVILSGVAPSRQWRKPVQLMDVVRAAVAEVEDYERIEVRRLPRLAVSGSAVGDLTHLLAELIENAAVFSPPHTAVRLHGEPVANGFVLEIDDRGLGLTPDALLEANLRLAETPEFELSDTDRLGLFVVSRLAQRQNVRVSLRQSPYGGTTAVVLIPANLLTETGDDTGSTRIGELTESRAEEIPADTEHTFRQWGLDGIGGETQKEHEAHPADEPVGPPVGASDEPELEGPLPLPRRRRTAPVLVSDRGRPVGGPSDRTSRVERDTPGQTPAAGGAPQPRPPAPAPVRQQAPGLLPARPQPAPEPAQAPAPAPAPVAKKAAAPGASGSLLPRRVRQANLAPQLRADPGQDRDGGGDGAGRERSADEVRDRMAALQRGWQRGREVADTTEPAESAGTPDATATTGTAEATETAENTETGGTYGGPWASAPSTTPEGNGR
ncbi:Signal transduction histidine kinase [Actinacidiphila alni]|uniref:histidine kinase n=1 Tax=Actinacidiphila alni TaxID=380248 RepID=A0A1I2JPV7_9ACTN|nr:nitrate- and nitrite sensing domain-containing protein [Actinacidiphila alni]SFF56148.1 Signal transduction histidine kinase [Actinacidiphila alni]